MSRNNFAWSFEYQNDISIEGHERSVSIFYQKYKVVVSSKYVQEYATPFLIVDDVKYEQMIVSSFENDYEYKEMKQATTYDTEGKLFPFVDQQRFFFMFSNILWQDYWNHQCCWVCFIHQYIDWIQVVV